MDADKRRNRDQRTYAIIGAAIEVHSRLGCGFLEAVYHDSMELEFRSRNILYSREHPTPIYYKEKQLGVPYRADFLCYGSIIVELKAIKALSDIEYAQILHYLKATNHSCGLLINFGSTALEYKRFVHTTQSL